MHARFDGAVHALQTLRVQLDHLVEGPESWREKYNLVFSPHFRGRVVMLAQGVGLPFRWHDPDQGHETDVRAFCEALDAYIPQLETYAAHQVRQAAARQAAKTCEPSLGD